MSIRSDLIGNLPTLRDLPAQVNEALASMCVMRSVAKDEIIYLSGGEEGRVFIILSGEVTLYRSAGGKRVVMEVFKTGDFFGDLSFTNHTSPLPSENYARALQPTTLCSITSADITKLLSQYSSFAMVLLITLRNRLHHAESKIRDLAIATAQTKVMNELIRYAVHHGHEIKGSYQIEKKISHQFLSEMTGLTRETVTKTLQKLTNLGFITYTPERLIKLNKNKIIRDCIQCLQF